VGADRMDGHGVEKGENGRKTEEVVEVGVGVGS